MRRVAAVLLGSLLLSGCGLPLPSGVQSPGAVGEDQPRDRDITVVPPGPQPDASPQEIVERFLVAQGSPADAHAVARQFLTPDAAKTWKDDTEVKVYNASRPLTYEVSGDDVTVTAEREAVVEPDGDYRSASGQVVDTYRVRCDAGRCRIAGLKDGLRLNRNDLRSSFAPRQVYFLAPALGEVVPTRHLVADLVWLPRTDEAQNLVQAVLDGPSRVLAGSVVSAVPAGTRLLRPVAVAPDGTVTVELSDQVRALDDERREQLSAQLVWTLRALGTRFRALRLLVGGAPLDVDGTAAPQPAQSWPTYDPERLPLSAPALYVVDRRVTSLDEEGLVESPASDGRQPVDEAAASPDGFLALLTARADGTSELRTGPSGGPFGTVRATGALSSPSWGSGEQGLFLLRAGGLVLLPSEGAPIDVPVEGTSEPLRQVRVARDGVRVALLVGEAERPSLLVGRIEQVAGGPRVVDLSEVAPGLRAVVDVSWETGTSLVVLSSFPVGRLPVRVPADGFRPVSLSSRLTFGLTPLTLTAAADRPVVLSGTVAGVQRVYVDDGKQFVDKGPGRAPFYPG